MTRIVPISLALAAAACGGGGGGGSHDGGDDTTGDDGAGDDGGGDDGGGGTDAATDGPGGGGDGGGGIDAAPVDCEPGIAPTHVTTMSSVSSLNYGEIITAGGRVFVTAPFGVPATSWLRWTGSAWSQEPIPWPSNLPMATGVTIVVQVASGNAVLVSQQPGAGGRWITTFDGTAMTPAIQLPASAGNPWAYTQTSDGHYHVFGNVGTPTGSMHVHVATKPGGGWYPADPLPIDAPRANEEVAAATAGDRLVVAYTNIFFDDDDPVHVHVLSRTATTTWTAAQDITPTWAVRANHLRMMAPPGGGVIVGASGAGSVVWRSPDGLAFGEYEQASAYGFLETIHAQCLENPIVVAGYQTAFRLEGRVNGSWTTLKDRAINYITDGTGAILPDGKTYFALGEINRHEYFATP